MHHSNTTLLISIIQYWILTISKKAFLPFHLQFWCWHKQRASEQ